jgi:membrane protein implicated in regulation of membrane protease activity
MIGIDNAYLRVRRLPWWQVALMVSIGLAIVIALAIVTAGLVLLLAPVVFLALLIRRLASPRTTGPSDVRATSRTDVIEAEYEVIEHSSAGESEREK